MRNKIFFSVCIMFLFSVPALAKDSALLDKALGEAKAGKLREAARSYYSFYLEDKKGKEAPLALAMTGRILDTLEDVLTEEAEKRCYWKKSSPMSPSCMQKEAEELNKQFGSGAFEYTGGVSLSFIDYTGSHYATILKDFGKSSYKNEAEFYLLIQGLKEHPDIIIPKVKKFLSDHKEGIWNRRGLLLWARMNQDIWNVWKKWTWVVYNRKISEDELIVKAEPYRQEALRTFKQLMSKKDLIGNMAAKEYSLLEAQDDDGILYSVTNDSSPGTWDKWGLGLTDSPK